MSKLPKCCPGHWLAESRTDLRKADKKCPCRGACGCRARRRTS